MRRSQTAKTSSNCVAFVDEGDRKKFCYEMVSILNDDLLKQKIFEKRKKFKTFTIKIDRESLSKIGLDPQVKLHFKTIAKTNELDLDIEVKRKDGALLEEYFDKV